ncbi:hypothetical protein ACJZ2D_009469 [Fusarium nematophilum]
MATVDDPSRDLESHGDMIMIVTITFSILSLIVASVRFYTRIFILRSFGLDDATMVAALASNLLPIMAGDNANSYLVDRHYSSLEPAMRPYALPVLYVATIFYNLSMNGVKLSFLFFYRRIFPEGRVRKACIGLIIFVGLWTVTQVLTVALSCYPLTVIVPSMLDHCLDTMPIWYLSAIMSTITDFIILLVPLPSVVKLNLPIRQKIAILSMFCLGFFTCAISVIRIFTLKRAAETTDPTYDLSGLACWSSVELNTGIICASLPTLRPLMAKFATGWSSTVGRDSYHMSGFSSALPRSLRPQKLNKQGSQVVEEHYVDQNNSTECLREDTGHQSGACSSGTSLVPGLTCDDRAFPKG